MLYEIAKLNIPIETKVFIKPSKEKIDKPLNPMKIVELNFSVNVDKHIFSSKIISPTSRNARVVLENNVTNNSTINSEEFIAIAQKKSLKKK